MPTIHYAFFEDLGLSPGDWGFKIRDRCSPLHVVVYSYGRFQADMSVPSVFDAEGKMLRDYFEARNNSVLLTSKLDLEIVRRILSGFELERYVRQ